MMIDEITSKFSAIKVTRIKSLEQYLDDMYLDYVAGNRNYFIEKDVNAILEDKSLSEKQLNLLAELFYRDALIQKEEKLKKYYSKNHLYCLNTFLHKAIHFRLK
jgi:hypothetical protein